eukprot:364608-Chlamydomonas_euryale.AAC.1
MKLEVKLDVKLEVKLDVKLEVRMQGGGVMAGAGERNGAAALGRGQQRAENQGVAEGKEGGGGRKKRGGEKRRGRGNWSGRVVGGKVWSVWGGPLQEHIVKRVNRRGRRETCLGTPRVVSWDACVEHCSAVHHHVREVARCVRKRQPLHHDLQAARVRACECGDVLEDESRGRMRVGGGWGSGEDEGRGRMRVGGG